jgi:hypothetical protein
MALPGGLLPIIVLLPNLLWMVWRTKESASESPRSGSPRVALVVAEWLGRIGTLVIPFFCRFSFESTLQVVFFAVMVGGLVLYYAGWIRYFVGGREPALLFRPLLGIPLPLAVSPIVAFFAAAVGAP